MLRKLRSRMEAEEGFTLIELLVVVLIIGILAAIALPSFLGQKAKGQDASAKSDARNLVSQVESCFATSQDYTACTTVAQLGTTGLNLVDTTPDKGQVGVAASDANSYVVTAVSKSGNSFTISKASGGAVTRGCSTSGGTTTGGCSGSTW